MTAQYFSLYSFAVPVQGKDQAIICNLYNAGYIIIPQFLCDILLHYIDKSVVELEAMYKDTSGEIKKHFDYLLSQNIGTYSNRLGAFPRMNLDWSEGAIIKYAAIRVDSIEKNDYKSLLASLINLGCRYIEVWCICIVDMDSLIERLRQTEDSIIRAIDLFVPYESNIDQSIYINSHTKCSKINNIYVYNAPYEMDLEKEKVFFKVENLVEDKYNADIDDDEYIIYSDFFVESMHRNPYYNNKICVDQDGYIKNCFQHKKNFGTISDINIEQVACSPEFQEMWFASNDKILEIRDSPFRYIWMNTHELTKIDNDLYSIVK